MFAAFDRHARHPVCLRLPHKLDHLVKLHAAQLIDNGATRIEVAAGDFLDEYKIDRSDLSARCRPGREDSGHKDPARGGEFFEPSREMIEQSLRLGAAYRAGIAPRISREHIEHLYLYISEVCAALHRGISLNKTFREPVEGLMPGKPDGRDPARVLLQARKAVLPKKGFSQLRAGQGP
jgi:hypothetical protein